MEDRRKAGVILPICVTLSFGLGILLGAVILGNSPPTVVLLSTICASWMFHIVTARNPTLVERVKNIFKKGS